MSTFITPSGCCTREVGMSKAHIPQTCEHGELLDYPKKLKRTPLNRVSKGREAQVRKQGSTLRRGRGMAASSAQQRKVKGLACVGCGREASEYVAIDPAHLTARGGQGGCDHPLCVAPLCRDLEGGCHRLFDEDKLDIYPALQDRGYYAEMAHAIEAHRVSPSLLVTRLSSGRWELAEVPERIGAVA